MARTLFPRLDEITKALLKDPIPRDPTAPLRVSGSSEPTVLADCDERAVAALGSLLVCKLIEHGGCALPIGPAQEACRKLLDAFSETDRHRLELEAVEVLRWLEDALNLLGDDWQEVEDRGVYPWEDQEFPDAGRIGLIRRAIQAKSDLEIEYYTHSRNAMTLRRVTPLEIEGERKLRAVCHWRRDERHFLLRRIKQVRALSSLGG